MMSFASSPWKPLEPVDESQHIRHQDVGDGEFSRQPLAFCEHGFDPL